MDFRHPHLGLLIMERLSANMLGWQESKERLLVCFTCTKIPGLCSPIRLLELHIFSLLKHMLPQSQIVEICLFLSVPKCCSLHTNPWNPICFCSLQRKQPTALRVFLNLFLHFVSLWLQTWSFFNRLAKKLVDTTLCALRKQVHFLMVYNSYFFAVQLCISPKLFSLKCPFSHMKNVCVGVGLLPLLCVLPGSKRIYTDKYVEPTSVENESGLLGHVLWYPKVMLLHCLFHMKLKSTPMWMSALEQWCDLTFAWTAEESRGSGKQCGYKR